MNHQAAAAPRVAAGERDLTGLRIGLSLVAAALAWLFPAGEGLALAIGVTFILAGIPHGAADHLVYRRVTGRTPDWRFFAAYGLLFLAYGLLWWAFPTLALLGFLFFSAYHFGQTQLTGLTVADRREATLLYLAWGVLVLATPLALHFPATAAVVADLIGYRPAVSPGVLAAVPLLSLATVVLLLLRRWRHGDFGRRALVRELVILAVLGLVFTTHGLLTGFAFFFLFWHTWPALVDQRRLLEANAPLSAGAYARQLLPLSAGAFLTLGLLLVFVDRLAPGSLSLASFFVFISLISLPHTLLMDRLYRLSGVAQH